MTSYGQGSGYGGGGGQSEGQPGWLTRADALPETSRRRKLAGYLKAANDLRQTYQQTAATAWKERNVDYGDDWGHDEGAPGAFPDAAVVDDGDEQMILFPSYARRHVKREPRAVPGTIQQASGEGRDIRDSPGAGDAEFWQKEWEKYENDHAIVDADVRGWIFSPHRGPMNRKQRLFIGLARQLAGLPAIATQGYSGSRPDERAPSGSLHHHHPSAHDRHEAATRRREEDAVAKEAEDIMRKGEAKADAAARGAYSEKPRDSDQDSLLDIRSRDNSPSRRQHLRTDPSPLAQVSNADTINKSEAMIPPLQNRDSWNEPSNMSAAELKSANSHLMRRLRPFLANPIVDRPISAFFYNDQNSQQRTAYTDASGHFTIRASLSFIPTHVRVLASEGLSATEEVIVTEPKGVSLISDIDDTIKHSAISSGAREIFRNAFIRELGDLTIDGVQKWYADLAKLGVKFHYVSNSPWQLYPVLTKYFALAGLPPGSFHLKQYSGMLQGIFEPVAERKKSTLDRLARDFPERSFILVGDSGEADIEVYTDFVLENPGRVLGVFIRDVTTTPSKGFFTSSSPRGNDGSPRGSPSRRTTPGASPRPSPNLSPRLGPTRDYGYYASSNLANNSVTASDQEDMDLQEAIKASLQDLEDSSDRPELPPRQPSGTTTLQSSKAEARVVDLIDLNDDQDYKPERRTQDQKSSHNAGGSMHDLEQLMYTPKGTQKSAPVPPRKPIGLQHNTSRENLNDSAANQKEQDLNLKTPPPKPRRPSSEVRSARSEEAAMSYEPNHHPSVPSPSVSAVGQKHTLAHDAIPDVKPQMPASSLARTRTIGSVGRKPVLPPPPHPRSQSQNIVNKRPPPLPPPRREMTSYAAGNRLSRTSTQNDTAPPAPPSVRSRPSYTTRSSTDRPSLLGRTISSSSIRSTHQSLNDDGSFRSEYWEQQPQLSKKEAMWQQRLARASRIFRDKGVLLKIWRNGGEAEKECLDLVEKALKREQDGNRSRSGRA